MKISDISSFMVVISTSIALLGAYIKVINGIFLSNIKSEFKYIPGEYSKWETIANFIIYIFLAIDFMGIIILLTLLGVIYNLKVDISSIIKASSSPIYAYIIAILMVDPIIISLINYKKIIICKDIFIKALYNKFNRECKKKAKNIMKFFKITNAICAISLFINVVSIIGYFICNVDSSNILLICMGLLIILAISNIVITNSITTIFKELEQSNLYIINISYDSFCCNCYLEYDNFYLIIKDNKECYIRKSEVKKILKKKKIDTVN